MDPLITIITDTISYRQIRGIQQSQSPGAVKHKEEDCNKNMAQIIQVSPHYFRPLPLGNAAETSVQETDSEKRINYEVSQTLEATRIKYDQYVTTITTVAITGEAIGEDKAKEHREFLKPA